MSADRAFTHSRSTAIGRWVGLGPYYAMFPSEFAFEVVSEHCPPGGAVLDPFAGRASSIYAAAALQRSGYGIEINAVGWLYGKVKLQPAPKSRVVARIRELGHLASRVDQVRLEALPPFFAGCYAPQVLRYLMVARDVLRWQTNKVDATLMAVILVHLHGKRSQSLSNQMRQGKAMSPDYCLRWWSSHGQTPPDLDPVQFLLNRVEWRYAKGTPSLRNGHVIQGDSTKCIPRLARKVARGDAKPFDLLFTSPPYYAVTNYNYDQWLRLWMLGSEDHPIRTRGMWESRFASRDAYRTLLEQVFLGCAGMMTETGSVYVRTDARSFTYETTRDVLSRAFPSKQVAVVSRPLSRSTQTALFGDKSDKPGEIDIILRPSTIHCTKQARS
jgi:hypothetical protein